MCVCVNEGEHMRENVDLYSLLFAVVEYAKKKRRSDEEVVTFMAVWQMKL